MRNWRQDGPYEIVIASDLGQVGHVQEQIAQRLKTCDFEDRDIFGIKLALEEALVNAIKHGNRLDSGKKVRIQIHVSRERLESRPGRCQADDRTRLAQGFRVHTYWPGAKWARRFFCQHVSFCSLHCGRSLP